MQKFTDSLPAERPAMLLHTTRGILFECLTFCCLVVMIVQFCHLCFLQGELLALQLPEKDTDEAVGTEILPLIGQSQNRDEERLADLDVGHANPHSFLFLFLFFKSQSK